MALMLLRVNVGTFYCNTVGGRMLVSYDDTLESIQVVCPVLPARSLYPVSEGLPALLSLEGVAQNPTQYPVRT